MKEDALAIESLPERLLPPDMELLPHTYEIFELELALAEIKTLRPAELVARSAFLKRVNGDVTHHYEVCSATPENTSSSIRTRSFFQKNRFGTGYGVHSLFPYRGKFHPQLIRGLLNLLDLKSGDVLLDPMCGSGTACVEANALGIESLGVDMSPFCALMSAAKGAALRFTKNDVARLATLEGRAEQHATLATEAVAIDLSRPLSEFSAKERVGIVAGLAFLDGMGFARRKADSDVDDCRRYVLRRYVATILAFAAVRDRLRLRLGDSKFVAGDARHLDLPTASVDAVVTSPPYSFAIDYVDNDLPQLKFMGVDAAELKRGMVGLSGKTREQKVEHYFAAMKQVLAEMARVLKPRKYSCVIVGSNEIQTGGIRLEHRITEDAEKSGLHLAKTIIKPIEGIQNSMTHEDILVFQKG